MLHYNARLKQKARRLRRDMTDAEQRIWLRVRRKQIAGVQFYRQKPIGPYIVDFYAPSVSLVIEIDGSQHLDADRAEYDEKRTRYLVQQGLRVLRFDNRESLRQTDAVLERIAGAVEEVRKNPPQSPFSKGGRA